MLSRVELFDRKAFQRCKTMVCIDEQLTCKVRTARRCMTISCKVPTVARLPLQQRQRVHRLWMRVQVLGYESVERYYRDASSFQYIHSIRTPCLFIVSEDDPFVRYASCPILKSVDGIYG